MTTPIRLSFFLTSDEHGFIRGASSLAATVDQARQENPDGVMLVSAGDVFEGSPTSKLIGTEPARELLQASGYEAVTLGNHDFDRGQAFTEKWTREAPCPVLNANVAEMATGQLLPGTRPYELVEKNGIKVGLVGVTTPEAPRLGFAKNFEGLEFRDPVAAVAQAQRDLREQGADVVCVLSHLGLPGDRALAEAVPGLTAILGGHTHDAMEHPEMVGSTPIIHAGAFRKSAGRLDVLVDPDTKKVVGTEFHLLQITDDTPAHGPVADIVKRYEDQMEQVVSQPVATIEKPLVHDEHEHDTMDDTVTDAMLEKGEAQVAVINKQFVRTGLPNTHVTVGDMMTAMPFDNRVEIVDMPVRLVELALNESYRRHDETSLAVGTDALSMVSSLDDHQVHLTKSDSFEPLAADATVRVALTDFLLAGGNGLFQPQDPARAHDFGLVRDCVSGVLAQGLSA